MGAERVLGRDWRGVSQGSSKWSGRVVRPDVKRSHCRVRLEGWEGDGGIMGKESSMGAMFRYRPLAPNVTQVWSREGRIKTKRYSRHQVLHPEVLSAYVSPCFLWLLPTYYPKGHEVEMS